MKPFIPQSYVGHLGGPNPTVQAVDVIAHPVLQDFMPERESLVSRLLAPTHFLITNAMVLDSEGENAVKPPFLYGDDIAALDFIVVAKEHCWLCKVNGRMMVLPSMVGHYTICYFQYESIARITGEAIFAFQGGVAFIILDCRGRRSKKIGVHWGGCILGNMT